MSEYGCVCSIAHTVHILVLICCLIPGADKERFEESKEEFDKVIHDTKLVLTPVW